MSGFEAVVLTIITASTPLLLAATGELVVERSGVLNLGVEGMMVMGAVCAFVVAYNTGSPMLGVGAGILAGIGMSLVFAFSYPKLGHQSGRYRACTHFVGAWFVGSCW